MDHEALWVILPFRSPLTAEGKILPVQPGEWLPHFEKAQGPRGQSLLCKKLSVLPRARCQAGARGAGRT